MAFHKLRYEQLTEESENDSIDSFTSAFDYGTPLENRKFQYRSIYSYSPALQVIKSEPVKEEWTSYFCRLLIIATAYCVFLFTLPISYWFVIKKLDQHQRLVKFRMGRLQDAGGPGRVVVFPYIDKCQKVDLRMRAFSIPPQQIITSDGAVIEIGADIQFRIKDAIDYVNKVKDLDKCMRDLARSLYVNILCKYCLEDIGVKKYEICASFQEEMNKTVHMWGLEISRMDMSSLKIHKYPDDPSNSVVSAIQGMFGGMSNSATASPGVPTLPCNLSNERIDPSKMSESDTTSYYLALVRKHLSSLLDLGRSDLTAIYKLEIIDQNIATRLYLMINNGCGHAVSQQDVSSNIQPDVSVSLYGKDFEDILSGSLSPLHAYIDGRIKVTGDVQLLMLFQDALQVPQANKDSTIIDI